MFIYIDLSFILFFVISSSCSYFLFLCGRFRRVKYIQPNRDKKNHIMVVSMLQNYSHIYSSYYSIIKIIDFEPIYYTINGIVSSSMIFNEFVCVFIVVLLF